MISLIPEAVPAVIAHGSVTGRKAVEIATIAGNKVVLAAVRAVRPIVMRGPVVPVSGPIVILRPAGPDLVRPMIRVLSAGGVAAIRVAIAVGLTRVHPAVGAMTDAAIRAIAATTAAGSLIVPVVTTDRVGTIGPIGSRDPGARTGRSAAPGPTIAEVRRSAAEMIEQAAGRVGMIARHATAIGPIVPATLETRRPAAAIGPIVALLPAEAGMHRAPAATIDRHVTIGPGVKAPGTIGPVAKDSATTDPRGRRGRRAVIRRVASVPAATGRIGMAAPGGTIDRSVRRAHAGTIARPESPTRAGTIVAGTTVPRAISVGTTAAEAVAMIDRQTGLIHPGGPIARVASAAI